MPKARRLQSKYRLGGRFRALSTGQVLDSLACELLEDRRLLSASPAEHVIKALAPTTPMTAQPMAEAVVSDASPAAFGSGTQVGLTPAQIRHAYGFDQIMFNTGASGTIAGDGAGQTIAIIEAYNDPNIVSDLAAFDTAFSLPAPPSFVRVNQTGGSTLPGLDPVGAGHVNWEFETALDVEWAHAMAPGASILLVEANSSGLGDLVQSAVDFARQQPNVVAVSMSFGAGEFSNEASALDSFFTTPANHTGVTFLGAAGDGGSPGIYPAYSPNVLAVGGTFATINANNTIPSSGEVVWNDVSGITGGGISQYEQPQPSYQSVLAGGISATSRVMPDVAFASEPFQGTNADGVAIYDSYDGGPSAPWIQVVGTSFSTPCWAALIAIADQGRFLAGLTSMDGPGTTLPKIYTLPSTDFNDVTSGTNGHGAVAGFAAGVGYDAASGRGTPKANLVVSDLIGASSVAGEVFNDANANATLDNGESGLQGWTVYQDTNNNSTYDAPATNTFSLSSLNLSIPNNNPTGVTSNNVVSGFTGNVLDVNVTLDITHPRDSDLTITLISPNNTSIVLASHVGGNGANFTGTTFDDSATLSITNALALAVAAPFSATFQPANAIALLKGFAANGTWKLKVVDNIAGASGGILNSWSLQITAGDPSTTSDASGNYQFTNLATGSYKIGEVLQAPYVETSPVGGFYNVALNANSVTGDNFGNRTLASSPLSGLVLRPNSDTGVSQSDGITKLNNSNGSTTLQFQVSGSVAGATVNVFDGINLIGSAVASGTTTIVTTDGVTTLSNGTRSITASQTEPGKSPSPSTPTLQIVVDTVPPTETITNVTPNPRTNPVTQMTITFSEKVNGLNPNDLQLTRNGGPNLLTIAQTVSSADGITFTLGNLAGITTASGFYELDLTLGNTPISDYAGNLDTTPASATFTVSPPSTVTNRLVFYAGSSRFDTTGGSQSPLPFSDDNAIATDKSAYLPNGSTAGFGNYTNYTSGINGIMVDLLGGGSHTSITLANILNDFTFKVGNNASPATWANAANPIAVSVRTNVNPASNGAGTTSGSDRVELIWADGEIGRAHV
jgi:subtilisin-like proprotein convertase family protein